MNDAPNTATPESTKSPPKAKTPKPKPPTKDKTEKPTASASLVAGGVAALADSIRKTIADSTAEAKPTANEAPPVPAFRSPMSVPQSHSVTPYVHKAEVLRGEVEKDDAPSQRVALPLRLVAAALITAGRDDMRGYLNNVYLHSVDGELRIVSTDGHRMVVSRCDLGSKRVPAWLEAGIMIPRDELSQALPLLTRNGAKATDVRVYRPNGSAAKPLDGMLVVEYGKGNEKLHLSAFNGFVRFSVKPADGKFPDYHAVLAKNAVAFARGEGTPMQTTAIQTRYVRDVADVAARLGATAIHAFIGPDPTIAAIFTFEGAPDTLLVQMPFSNCAGVSSGVVKILGESGIAPSLAAFRAHLTRTTKALAALPDGTKSKEERDKLQARRERFESEIKRLIEGAKSGPAKIEQAKQKAIAHKQPNA